MSDARPEWYQLRDTLEQGDLALASAMLDKDPGLIDERNGLGESLLHFLAVENDCPAVEWLHARGANLNSVNTFGTPLLFEVAHLGHSDLLAWLIEHGADLRKTNTDGQQIDEYLAEFNPPAVT